MPEDLAKGLYLSGVGMGLVFVALVAFMLTMMLLQRLFPDDTVEPEKVGSSGGDAIEKAASVETAEPPRPAEVESRSGPSGARIAAMAVPLYLAMEEEEMGLNDYAQVNGQTVEAAAVAASPSAPATPQAVSNWTTGGRTALMESQSHRPTPYGQKLHSGYPQRNESP